MCYSAHYVDLVTVGFLFRSILLGAWSMAKCCDCTCVFICLHKLATDPIIKNVSIEFSFWSPMAGEEFRMTCLAVSNGQAILSWIDPRGDIVTSNNPHITLELVNGDLSLLFQPLYTSHGGVYTCVASVGSTLSAEKMKADYLLSIHSKTTGHSIFHIIDGFFMFHSSSTCDASNKGSYSRVFKPSAISYMCSEPCSCCGYTCQSTNSVEPNSTI